MEHYWCRRCGLKLPYSHFEPRPQKPKRPCGVYCRKCRAYRRSLPVRKKSVPKVKYKAGSIVVYTVSGVLRRVMVHDREKDIHNGKPGFIGVELDYKNRLIRDPSGNTALVWGYDEQILEVLDV